MNCSKCGAEIKEGCLFCSVCGAEAVVVRDAEVLEDDYLKAILNDDEPQELQGKQKDKGENHQNIQEKRKRRLVTGFLLSVLVLEIVVGVVLYIGHRTEAEHASSYEYQVAKAQEAYREGHLSDAISYYRNAIALNPDEVDLRILLASIYMNLAEYDQAQYLYMETLQIEPENAECYRRLLAIYEKREDLTAILGLMESAGTEELRELFSDYMVSAPLFSEETGVYENYLELELFSNGANRILYTTDNSDPAEFGIPYEKPLLYTDAGTYVIRAVCVNEKGLYSRQVKKEYKVVIPAPDMPVVFPDGGEFRELTAVFITVPEGCTAYYTWDGTNPSILSAAYTEPMLVPEGNNVLSVLSVDNVTGLTSSIYGQYFKYYP